VVVVVLGEPAMGPLPMIKNRQIIGLYVLSHSSAAASVRSRCRFARVAGNTTPSGRGPGRSSRSSSAASRVRLLCDRALSF
jgi:hypothetical protein